MNQVNNRVEGMIGGIRRSPTNNSKLGVSDYNGQIPLAPGKQLCIR